MNNEYNNHKSLRYLSNNIIECLVNDNEILWKLLKYQVPNALDYDNLTKSEKRELIYKGWIWDGTKWVMEDINDKNVFMQPWLDDSIDTQISTLRIFLTNLIPENKHITTAIYTIEAVVHNKSIPIVSNLGNNDNETIVNYENRLELLTQQILETLNGKQVGSIGRIFFDMDGSYMTKGNFGLYNNRNFCGFRLLMGCKINGID